MIPSFSVISSNPSSPSLITLKSPASSVSLKVFLSLVFTLLALSSCVSEDTKVDPAQSKIHYDLALELAQYSLYQNALEEFDLAIKFDSGNINAYRKKGLVEFGLKQYEEAEKLFKKVMLKLFM